ncbi:MAG TPA: ABC transporter ATP-binding protein [Actinomycetes bacterium]
MPVIEVRGLSKAYGSLVAVDDLDLTVEAAEIFGVVGPNGAGKTTTVECITGLRVPDSGSIRVLGRDPQTDRNEVRQRVGVQLQESALPAKIRVSEVLELFGSFYRRSVDIPDLVESLGLAAHRDVYFRALSGGLKQRLSIALALVGDPEVAVLDELTTGLDPHARQETWELIESVRARGVTVVVVTHSMEEAERLCDRVAVIDQGRLVACGTPTELTEQGGGLTRMSFRTSGPFPDELLTSLPDVSSVHRHGDTVVVTGVRDLVTDVVLALHGRASGRERSASTRHPSNRRSCP